MKAIMISIKPKWVAEILNKEKIVEVRKGTTLYKAIQKLIDEYGYADIYAYCTKDKSLIYTDGTDGKGEYVDYKYYESYKGDKNDIGSGKVVFKFRCYNVEEITTSEDRFKEFIFYETSLDMEDLLNQSCLDYNELDNYLYGENGTAIHINYLEIFDEPKELSEFYPVKWNKCGVKDKEGLYQCDKCPYGGDWQRGCRYEPLSKAPVSWCYVEVE